MNATHEDRLEELKLELPPAPKPMGVYRTLLTVDKLVYVSGHGPLKTDGSLVTGRLGQDMDIEQGQAAARQVGLAIVSTMKSHLGSLNRVKRVVKILGMVNSTPGFPRSSEGHQWLQ